MSGINPGVAYDVCRLRVMFVDNIGNPKNISGTGFWLKHKGGKAFVTNKHNVDPALKLGADTLFSLHSLEIELRKFAPGKVPTSETKFVPIDMCKSIVQFSPHADAVVIFNPVYSSAPGEFRSAEVLSSKNLANVDFLSQKLAMMDMASFIGFAGNQTSQWWDQTWNLGIARTVNIASVPDIPFTHQDIQTTDVTLVAGLSFSGSSGSVVISHEKGIKPGAELSRSDYVPPKIIGIMSGHWWDDQQKPGMFTHSGLSYFTRSTTILSLLSMADR